MEKLIILIGGMPTVGKSTIAEMVAKHYDLPWISTDQIRMIMQTVANHDERPALFAGMNMSADEFFETYSVNDIIQQEREYGEEVWAGVKRFIDTNWVWKKGCVIEGVGIFPKLAAEYTDESGVKTIFLSDENTDHIREIIYERGLFTHPEKYSNEMKEKEIEWIKAFDQTIRQEAEQYGFPVVAIAKDSNDINKVLEILSK